MSLLIYVYIYIWKRSEKLDNFELKIIKHKKIVYENLLDDEISQIKPS